MHRLRAVAVALALALVLAASSAPAFARNRVAYPAGSKPFGSSYTTWAERWVAWAFGTPVPSNALADPANCDVGQSAPVFFLPVSGGGPVSATCTVPAGSAILVTPGGDLEIQGVTADTIEAAEQNLHGFVSSITDVEVTVDGQAVPGLTRFLLFSPVFTLTLPSDNLYGAPAGSYSAVTGGYFLILYPLSIGEHTITAFDAAPSLNFEASYTYDINVVPS
jgi:hypothetical protein